MKFFSTALTAAAAAASFFAPISASCTEFEEIKAKLQSDLRVAKQSFLMNCLTEDPSAVLSLINPHLETITYQQVSEEVIKAELIVSINREIDTGCAVSIGDAPAEVYLNLLEGNEQSELNSLAMAHVEELINLLDSLKVAPFYQIYDDVTDEEFNLMMRSLGLFPVPMKLMERTVNAEFMVQSILATNLDELRKIHSRSKEKLLSFVEIQKILSVTQTLKLTVPLPGRGISPSADGRVARRIHSLVAEHCSKWERIYEDPIAGISAIYLEFPDFADHLKTMTSEQLKEQVARTEAYLDQYLTACRTRIPDDDDDDEFDCIFEEDDLELKLQESIIENLKGRLWHLKASKYAEKKFFLLSSAFKAAVSSLDLFPVSEEALLALEMSGVELAKSFIDSLLNANMERLRILLQMLQANQVTLRKGQSIRKLLSSLELNFPYLYWVYFDQAEQGFISVTGEAEIPFTADKKSKLSNLILSYQEQVTLIEAELDQFTDEALVSYLKGTDFLKILMVPAFLKEARMLKYTPLDLYQANHIKALLKSTMSMRLKILQKTALREAVLPQLLKKANRFAKALNIETESLL